MTDISTGGGDYVARMERSIGRRTPKGIVGGAVEESLRTTLSTHECCKRLCGRVVEIFYKGNDGRTILTIAEDRPEDREEA